MISELFQLANSVSGVGVGAVVLLFVFALWVFWHRLELLTTDLDELATSYEKHTEKCAHDWESQRVINEHAKGADEKILAICNELRARFDSFEASLAAEVREFRRDIKNFGEDLARLEGATNAHSAELGKISDSHGNIVSGKARRKT